MKAIYVVVSVFFVSVLLYSKLVSSAEINIKASPQGTALHGNISNSMQKLTCWQKGQQIIDESDLLLDTHSLESVEKAIGFTQRGTAAEQSIGDDEMKALILISMGDSLCLIKTSE